MQVCISQYNDPEIEQNDGGRICSLLELQHSSSSALRLR